MNQRRTRVAGTNVTADAPVFPTVREGGIQSFYANEMNVVETPRETLIDFSLISPIDYFFDDEGLPSARITHEIVARCFLPAGTFREFVAGYVRNHPDVVKEVTNSTNEED